MLKPVPLHLGGLLQLVAGNERQAGPDFLLVDAVLLPEEVEQHDLLDGDALAEEEPAGNGIRDHADWVQQDQLGADRPVEPAHVARVAEPAVDAVGYENVIGGFLTLHLKKNIVPIYFVYTISLPFCSFLRKV